jgi:hypothetical protein
MNIKMARLACAVSFLGLIMSGSVQAGDLDTGNDSNFFGNIRFALGYQSSSAGGSALSDPYSHVVGKFAIQPVDSRLGIQVDFGGQGEVLNLIRPSLPIDGTYITSNSVAHVSYDVNDDVKLGVFGGFEHHNETLTKVTDPTYSYYGLSNLSKASHNYNAAQLGIEALYAIDPQSWVQGRIGYVQPLSASNSWTDTTGTATLSNSIDLTKDHGFEIGLGARFGITPHVSLRGDTNFYSLALSGGGYEDQLSSLVTAQYIFGSMPLSAYVEGGYNHYFTDAVSVDTAKVAVGMSWSFGGTTDTVRGKLFRSAGIDGTFN